MIFTDRVIVLLFVGAVVLAVGLVGPMVRLADAELGRIALVAGAAIDAVVVVLLALDRGSLGRRRDAGRDVVVRRRTEDILSQGTPNVVRVSIENHTKREIRIELTDTLPSSFETDDALPLKATVPAGSRLELSYLVRPMVRGEFQLGALHLRRYGRLNLVARQERREASQTVSVYPDIYGMARSRLLMAQAGRKGAGPCRTRVLGEGREFHRLRPYVYGDDTRLIDWKVTAKHGEPTVREFELERNQRLVIVLDSGRLMTAEAGGRLTKLDHAVAAAMGLANVALLSGDRVGLLVFSKEVRGYLPPQKGAGQFRRLVEMLARAEADLFEPDYAYALGYLASRLSRRSLVVMLTDLSAGGSNSAMVARLSALLPRHLPICVTIHDPQLSRVALAEPRRPFDAFRAAAAREVLRDQRMTRQVLTSRGVVAIDVEAEELLPVLVSRYLDIKARGRL